MAGRGPKPYTQRSASTVFLRVPREDWPLVKRGHKTEFRSGIGRNVTQGWNLVCPCPVVAYSVSKVTGYDNRLMLLEETWREPLGAITPESLEREGFSSFAEFRRYFMARERRHFTPTREVSAWRLRPWESSDFSAMAESLLKKLYGDFLPSADAPMS